jgi:D-glycero-D-manno-heptose 1,7-bisphosphate phosphatase
MAELRRAVFLDRDGVLVIPEFRDGRSYAVRSLDQFQLYPEAEACLHRLKAAGFCLVVVTNQPDLGSGLVEAETVAAMHSLMLQALPLDSVQVCPHTAQINCDCRKPNPGMILTAAQEFGIDLEASFMVGDRASDIAAGKAAGCGTAFIDLGYTAETAPTEADHVAVGLETATDWILAEQERAMSR